MQGIKRELAGDGPAIPGDPGIAGNNDIAYIDDPYSTTSLADSATAGSGPGAGSNDLAEVLFTHGDASAQGANLLYDIISLFGNTSGSF